jgi:hypothetical protein
MPKECGPGFLIQEKVTQSRLAPTSKTEMISGVDKSKKMQMQYARQHARANRNDPSFEDEGARQLDGSRSSVEE